jgi:outer membrane protein assembly factor BamE
MRFSVFLMTVIASLLLSACGGFGVHKIDIQQGNLVTQDQMARVKTGMSRLDVRNVLGTPLLQDAFSGNRWDYWFSEEHGKFGPFGRDVTKFKVTVIFENEKVARIEGTASPSEIFLGGGEQRRLPNAIPPGAPEPKKSSP